LGLSPADGEVGSDAVQLIVDSVLSSPDPVHLLALGPLTNVARALALEPDIGARIASITIMGGAVDVNGSVSPGYAAEWNLWVDPAAANAVLASGVDITLVPLDATNDVPATRFFVESLEEHSVTSEANLVYDYFAASPQNLDGGSYFFWDPLAAVVMVELDAVDMEQRTVAVLDGPGGRQGAVIETSDGVEVTVATSADRRRFEEVFLSGLNGGDPVTIEIPKPDLTVTFTGDGCVFEGSTTYQGTEETTRVVVRIVNDSEKPVELASGLHEGVSWEELEEYVADIDSVTEPPSFWEQTGAPDTSWRIDHRRADDCGARPRPGTARPGLSERG
jgi:hypothetical protein